MAGKLIGTAVLSTAAAGALTVLYGLTAGAVLLPLAITCGTIAYHIDMRLLARQRRTAEPCK